MANRGKLFHKDENLVYLSNIKKMRD
jgi:hypothetical protein